MKKVFPKNPFPVRPSYLILTAALLLFLLEWTGLYSMDISAGPAVAPWLLNAFDVLSAVLLVCLFAYLLSCVLFRFDRTIRYHGAEHKALHAFQSGRLNFEGAKSACRVSRWCGTELFVSVVPLYGLFFLFTDSELIRFLMALSLGMLLFNLKKADTLPVISLVFKLGYFFQRRLLTREPDDEQLGAAVKAVVLLVETELNLPALSSKLVNPLNKAITIQAELEHRAIVNQTDPEGDAGREIKEEEKTSPEGPL